MYKRQGRALDSEEAFSCAFKQIDLVNVFRPPLREPPWHQEADYIRHLHPCCDGRLRFGAGGPSGHRVPRRALNQNPKAEPDSLEAPSWQVCLFAKDHPQIANCLLQE